jgi:hypothetical protein
MDGYEAFEFYLNLTFPVMLLVLATDTPRLWLNVLGTLGISTT